MFIQKLQIPHLLAIWCHCIHGHRKQSLYFFIKGFTSPNKPTPSPDFHFSHLPSISNPATPQAWLSWASSRPTCPLNSCSSCHRCRCCWWIPTTSVCAAARRTSRRAAARRRCSWQRRSCSTCGRAPRICCRDPLRRRNGWRGACMERGERVRKSGKVTLRWIFASFTDFQHFIYVFFPGRTSIQQSLNRCASKCHVPMFNLIPILGGKIPNKTPIHLQSNSFILFGVFNISTWGFPSFGMWLHQKMAVESWPHPPPGAPWIASTWTGITATKAALATWMPGGPRCAAAALWRGTCLGRARWDCGIPWGGINLGILR